jgi:hypothetical protein
MPVEFKLHRYPLVYCVGVFYAVRKLANRSDAPRPRVGSPVPPSVRARLPSGNSNTELRSNRTSTSARRDCSAVLACGIASVLVVFNSCFGGLRFDLCGFCKVQQLLHSTQNLSARFSIVLFAPVTTEEF